MVSAPICKAFLPGASASVENRNVGFTSEPHRHSGADAFPKWERDTKGYAEACHECVFDEGCPFTMFCPVGWVLLDLLKSEQDRIGRRLAFLEAQIEAGDMEYELASAHLDDCLALGRDCYKLYMSIDDSLRRIANQAFFDKLYLSEEGTVIGEPGEPFNAFFDPGVQTIAARHEGRAAESRSQTGNVAGLNNDLLVGPAGLEPATNGLKVQCSTN